MPSCASGGHKVVRLILMRHGEREKEGGELAQLTTDGRRQAETLGWWLEGVPMRRPQAILCSSSKHAHQQATIASGLLPKGVPVIRVKALAPDTAGSQFSLAVLRREVDGAIKWRDVQNVACIGHEPKLSQLAQAMTGEMQGALGSGEVLYVEGDSWEALDAGRGRLALREIPAKARTDETEEAKLLPKIQSKMQTSALLAGFTSTVFGVVLTESAYWTPDLWTPWTVPGARWPPSALDWRAASVAAGLACLALATLLFVVSIYMYDRLAMPRRYWVGGADTRRRQDLWRRFRRDRVGSGLVYAYMVWVWRFVFSAAVGMAMLGFLALVLHRRVWPVAVLFLLAITASTLYYVVFRPDLGVD
jgi:phosphohistidine phosphatase SixA